MYKFLSQIDNPYVVSYGGSIPSMQCTVTAGGSTIATIKGVGSSSTGIYKMYSIRDYVRYYMRNNDLMLTHVKLEFRVTASSAVFKTDEFDCIYCDRKVLGAEATDFLCRRFFRSGDVTFLAEGVKQQLPYMLPVSGSCWFERKWYYTDDSGVARTVTHRNLVSHQGTMSLSCPSEFAYSQLQYARINLFAANNETVTETIASKTYSVTALTKLLGSVVKTYNDSSKYYTHIRIQMAAMQTRGAFVLASAIPTIAVLADGKTIASQKRSTTADMDLQVAIDGASRVDVKVLHTAKVTLPAMTVTIQSSSVDESLRTNGISLDVFPVRGSQVSSFRFRNIFNAYQVLSLPASVETKPETSSETVVCSGESSPYDMVTTMPHEVKFGVQHQETIDMLRQMCASHRVELWYQKQWVPIVITDYEVNDSTDVGSYNEPSLTFEFAEQQPYAAMGDIEPAAVNSGTGNEQGNEGDNTGGGSGTGTGGNEGGGTVSGGDEGGSSETTPGTLVGTLMVRATQGSETDDYNSTAVLGTPTAAPPTTWMTLSGSRINILKDSDIDFDISANLHIPYLGSSDYPRGSTFGILLYDEDGNWLADDHNTPYPSKNDATYSFSKQWHVPAGGYIIIDLSSSAWCTLNAPISITIKQRACDGRYDE